MTYKIFEHMNNAMDILNKKNMREKGHIATRQKQNRPTHFSAP